MENKTQSKAIGEEKGKLLGFTFDNNITMATLWQHYGNTMASLWHHYGITMAEHIKNMCKQAGNKLYALARIAHFLNERKREILMKSFIISQLNYCPII